MQTFSGKSQAESKEVTTTCVSGWIHSFTVGESLAHPLTQVVLTSLPGLLLRSFLSSGFVGAVAAPDSFQDIRFDFISHKSAACAADAYGDIGSLLDAHAIGVIAPNESIQIAGRLDPKLGLVFFAVGILTPCVVVSFQT